MFICINFICVGVMQCHMLSCRDCLIIALERLLLNLTRCISLQNFKHIMKHLQGAIIIGGAFQVLLGYTGLMSLFLRCAAVAVY
jgi:hypothetical protein